MKKLIIVLSVCLLSASAHCKEVSLSFNGAELKEIVLLITDHTGKNFVFDESITTAITWVQDDIDTQELIPVFVKILESQGLICKHLPDHDIYMIIQENQALSGRSFGIHRLKNVSGESVLSAIERLYGQSLKIGAFDNNTLLFNGPDTLVNDLQFYLTSIDQLNLRSGILAIDLNHISVTTALEALNNIGPLEKDSYYPDYWQKKIVAVGNEEEKVLIKSILESIDKPQSGWVDHLEYVYTMEPDKLASILESCCGAVKVNAVGDNRVLLSGQQKDINRAIGIIHKIDGSGMQVKVEAVIAYLTSSEYEELGLKLSYAGNNLNLALNDSLPGSLLSGNTGLLTEWFTGSLGITAGSQKGNSSGRIISSPVVTVANGQEAEISVGQNVPFISNANYDKNNGTTTGTDISREDVGVTFSVKPFIEKDGDFVRLVVNQEVSNVASESELSQDAVDIVTDTKKISSTVIIPNGGVIFIGGSQSEEVGESKTYIPVLGHLLFWVPGLGDLLSYTTTEKETRHLIVSLRVSVLGHKT